MIDYLIIGGGSAGAVLANRLSAKSSNTVALVEAGEDYLPGSEPAEILDTFHTAVFRSQSMWPGLEVLWPPTGPNSNKETAERRWYPQAKIMGGGSSVNAMAAIRGVPDDYDQWDAGGAKGWAWDKVMPYFVRLEADHDFNGSLHGQDGPIPIRRNARNNWPPFAKAVANTLNAWGYEYIDDINTNFNDGLCAIPVNSLPDRRVSTATGYLDKDCRNRENLKIFANCTAKKILFEGKTAVGAIIKTSAGNETIRAKQTIIAAGALHSPALLMRSGVGPAENLKSVGVTPITNLQGVGENLQDHPVLSIAAHLRREAVQSKAWRPAPNVSLRYSSGLSNCDAGDCWLSIANKTSWNALGNRIGALGASVYKPYSQGRVSLIDNSYEREPNVQFNVLSDERDLVRIKMGLQLAYRLYLEPTVKSLINEIFPASFSPRIHRLNQYSTKNAIRAALGSVALDGPAILRRWLIKNIINDGPSVESLIVNENELNQWIRENTTGFFHPVGTCKMGKKEDKMAVVDPQGRVYGLSGLRVIDASVMPQIVRANTNIPTIMIAEKMSDHILGRN